MPKGTLGKVVLAALPVMLLALLAVSIADLQTAERLFVSTTYYFLMVTVLCWAGTYLYSARGLRRHAVLAWAKENWPGLAVALAVTVSVGLAVDPGLRMLSDEANLVGTSKNLFASKTATFTVSGKYYYGNYWDVDVAIDRRPTLFPFLVSLVHAVCGYSYRNAFLLNLLVVPAFCLVSYRLAKSLGGETLGVVSASLVVAHPITLLSARSGGFDFLATFFALLVIKSLLDACRKRSPTNLAILWMNLCMFAEVRYESALFIVPVLFLLVLFGMVTWRALVPYAFIYALTPAYLLPRIWQSMLRGSVPEQEPGADPFSIAHLLANAADYFRPVLALPQSHPAHSSIVIGLGIIASLLWLRWFIARVRAGGLRTPEPRFAVFVAAWMLLQGTVVFSYVWGRPLFPSSARLFLAVDTFFSFGAAWVLTRSLQGFRPFVAVLPAVAALALALPVAAQGRLMNRLTQTRESAATWSFFERLHEQRILVITDRPNHFTIMNYGAMSFEAARKDPYLLTALERRLFQDVYVIQQIALKTNEPLPGYELWPERKLDTVLEFQNDANVLVRVSRLAHGR